MRRTFWAVVLGAVLTAGLASGCDDDCTTGCEKAHECNDAISVGTCVNECDDALNDGRVSDSDVSRCADCLDSNSCGEIASGDCNEACSGLF